MKSRNFTSELIELAQRYGVNGSKEPFIKRCVETLVKEGKMTSRSFVLMSEALVSVMHSEQNELKNLQVKK